MEGKKEHKGAGHRKRLRDRFMAAGLSGFQDYEVIELLLTLATPRKDCKESAKAALARFKTFRGVVEAPDSALCEIPGIGPVNVFGLKLIKAAADRYLENRLEKTDPLTNSRELFDYLYHVMRDKPQELFKAIFLDAKNRILHIETLSEGTLTASPIYPREVVKKALEQNAAAIIFAHNHPSGDPSPSREDFAITRQLLFACRLMNIVVHEHLIIGNNAFYSFSDQGHIREMNAAFETRSFSDKAGL